MIKVKRNKRDNLMKALRASENAYKDESTHVREERSKSITNLVKSFKEIPKLDDDCKIDDM